MVFYIDTSVWGGYFDEEFKEMTVPFFEQLRKGKFEAIISNVTFDEIMRAPLFVREFVASIPEEQLEFVTLTKEQQELATEYVKEGALTKNFYTDAQHIAIATILKVDSLVSWNFKHMVNFFRIRQYNSINLKYGYSTIDIRTPKEVVYEK